MRGHISPHKQSGNASSLQNPGFHQMQQEDRQSPQTWHICCTVSLSTIRSISLQRSILCQWSPLLCPPPTHRHHHQHHHHHHHLFSSFFFSFHRPAHKLPPRPNCAAYVTMQMILQAATSKPAQRCSFSATDTEMLLLGFIHLQDGTICQITAQHQGPRLEPEFISASVIWI